MTLEIARTVSNRLVSITWSDQTLSSASIWLTFCVVAIIWLLDRSDLPQIENLPSVRGLPIFGSLVQLGEQQARKLAELSETHGPVFQFRLGNKRFIAANTFDSIRRLWINHQSSLISRPKLHTFHNILSSSQGFTIGTSPWDESCKRRRKAAATALNRPSVASYMPYVDLESFVSVRELLQRITHGQKQTDIDPYPMFQRLALNLSLTIGYGFRIEGTVDDDLLREIITVERGISTLRSTSNNWQDFVPLLRLFSRRSDEASGLRQRRDKYLEHLLRKLEDRIATGTDLPCITGNILKDPEYKLTHEEIKSICVTMIAGGLDTTPACILLGIAILSGPQGAELQEKLLKDIGEIYPHGDAWQKCLEDEKCEFVTAFCKEVLRFWTVIPMSLPRVSIKDIGWEGAIIPAGTTFLMNAYAGNFDPAHFNDPRKFDPERFLNIPEGAGGTQHLAFGAGSRMCTGSHLAYREMYVTFVRMLLAFEILPAEKESEMPCLKGPLEINANPVGLSIEPRPFKVGMRIRGGASAKQTLEGWLRRSDEATRGISGET